MADRTLRVVLQANIASLRAGLTAGATEVKQFGRDVNKVGQDTSIQTDRIGRGFVMAGAVIAGALGAATYQAIQFEQELVNVTTISDHVEANFQETADALIGMSNELPQSARELAAGLYDVASSGFAGKEGMVVLENAAKAASAGLSTTATSARAITGALNAYGMEAKDSREISDLMFQTVNLGVVTFEELAQNLGDVVGIAAAAKVSFKDLGAAYATITLAGIPAAEASTALNRVITTMLDPGEALKDKFIELGYESGEMALKTDGLKTVMTKLRETTGDSTTAFLQLFPEIRAARGALALTAAEGANWTRVTEGMNDATKGAGATARALERQQQSLAYQMTIVKNQVVNLGIAFTTGLLPPLKFVGRLVSEAVSSFMSMPGPLRTGIAVTAAFTAAALVLGGGLLLLAARIGRMRHELEMMGPAGVKMAAGMNVAGRSIALASGAAAAAYGFSTMGDSIEGTVLGVMSLVTAAGLLRQGLPGLQATLARVGGTLATSTNPGVQSAGVALGNMGAMVGRLGRMLPGLAVAGATAAASFGEIGKSSAGTAIGIGSLAATGAMLGTAVLPGVGTALGAAAGAAIGFGKAIFGAGESASETEARIGKLASALDGLGKRRALGAFADSLKGMESDLARVGVVTRGFITDLGELARKSPSAARQVVDGLVAIRKETGEPLSTAEYERLTGVIEKNEVVYAKRIARGKDMRAENERIAASEVSTAEATLAMTSAQTKAAEEFGKRMDAMAEAAAGALPSVQSAFQEATKKAEEAERKLTAADLRSALEEKLKTITSFSTNLQLIVAGGFANLANLISMEGPATGGALAQEIADAIRRGEPAIAESLNLAAARVDTAQGVFQDNFRNKLGPAITKGMGEAFAGLSPSITAQMGIAAATAAAGGTQVGAQAMTAIANSINAQKYQVAQEAFVAGRLTWEQYQLALSNIPAETTRQMQDAAARITTEKTALARAAFEAGHMTWEEYQLAISAIATSTTKTVNAATGAVQAGTPALEGAGGAAGQKTTDAFGKAADGMAAKAGDAVRAAGAPITTESVGLERQEAREAGERVGRAFGNGIVAGINSKEGAVRSAAAGLVAAAEGASMKKAEAESPSKLFARIGGYLAQGIVVGMRGGIPAVMRESAAMMTAAAGVGYGGAAAGARVPGSGQVVHGAARAGAGGGLRVDRIDVSISSGQGSGPGGALQAGDVGREVEKALGRAFERVADKIGVS